MATKKTLPEKEEATPTSPETETDNYSLASDPAPEATRKTLPATPYAVVGPDATDTVAYSAAVPPTKTGPRKSLTVHHLQRRLNERGFASAYADTDGRYGDLTAQGVREYQADLGADETGLLTREQFSALFEGDPNVTVVIDTHKDH